MIIKTAYRWRQHEAFWGHTGRAWVSAEPLAASLATVALSGACTTIYGGASGTSDPTWEFDLDWVREALDKYGPERTYFKQIGDIVGGRRVGKKAAGRVLDGRTWDVYPTAAGGGAR